MKYHLSIHLRAGHTETQNFNSLSDLNFNLDLVEYLTEKLSSGQAFLFDGTGCQCYLTATKYNEENKKCLVIIIQKNGLNLLDTEKLFSDLILNSKLKSESYTKHGNLQLTYCLKQ